MVQVLLLLPCCAEMLQLLDAVLLHAGCSLWKLLAEVEELVAFQRIDLNVLAVAPVGQEIIMARLFVIATDVSLVILHFERVLRHGNKFEIEDLVHDHLV